VRSGIWKGIYHAHLLNELLETDVPWVDAIVVSAGKLRKLWDSLSELRSYVCERRLERTVLRPALLLGTTAQFTQFFRLVCRHTVKITQFNWECIGRNAVCVKTKKSREQPCYNVRSVYTLTSSEQSGKQKNMDGPQTFLVSVSCNLPRCQ